MKAADPVDAALLNMLQAEFPLDPHPFAAFARRLRTSEEDVISRIERLKADGIIRQISAIFDSSALGYSSLLAAFRVDPDRLDDVAAAVSGHDGVSHCYARDSQYNLWFTLTAPRGADPAEEVRSLARRPEVLSAMLLPAQRVFKIGVFLQMGDDAPSAVSSPATPPPSPETLTDDDRAAVRVLQEDLPLVPQPFAALAGKAATTEEELLGKARDLRRRGVMRRFAAVLRHAKAGYAVNAMICWAVEPQKLEQVGRALAADPAVSHCYERPVYPDWPYPLYTMAHCRSEEELDDVVRRLSQQADGADHRVLRTRKEYKKRRVSYF